MSKPFSSKAWVFFVVVALLAFAGCSPAEPADSVESGARKVVTFEGGEVTEGEVQEAIGQFAQQSGAGEIPPGSPQYEAAVQQVMPQLVGIEIARVYADENDITVSQGDVDQEIETIKDQISEQAEAAGEDIGREEAFQTALDQAGFTEEQLRQDIREQLPVQKVQEEVVENAEPTDEEIQAFYDENRELQFSTPEQRCISHILFNADQEQRAEDVKEELEDDGDFAELAEEFSQDPGSREQGGELGCQGRGAFVPEFEDAAFEAEEGEIVGPVETEFGYHVIEVTEIQPESTAPLDEVRPQIRQQLAQEQQIEEFEGWLEDQREQRDVQYLPGYDPDQATPEAAEPGEVEPEVAPEQPEEEQPEEE